MQLYDHPDCPYGVKVRIALAETECEYETIRVDLASGQQHSPEFLKINPFGQVPVLIDDAVVLYDSTIINEYLNEWYASVPGLLPDLEDAPERARVRLLEDFADRAFTPAVMALEAEYAKAESAALRLERLGIVPGDANKNVKEWLMRLAGRSSVMTVMEMAA